MKKILLSSILFLIFVGFTQAKIKSVGISNSKFNTEVQERINEDAVLQSSLNTISGTAVEAKDKAYEVADSTFTYEDIDYHIEHTTYNYVRSYVIDGDTIEARVNFYGNTYRPYAGNDLNFLGYQNFNIGASGNNTYGIGIGYSAQGNHTYGIGIGWTSKDNYDYGVGVGYNTYGNLTHGIGIGMDAYQNYTAGIGIGEGALLNHTVGIGIGGQASHNDSYGIGMGYSADYNNASGIGIGRDADNNANTGLGIGFVASNNSAIGIGIGRYANYNQNYGIGIGNGASYNSAYGIGIGYDATYNLDYAIGIGAGSKYNKPYATSVGAYTKAGSSSVAIGYNAKANAVESIAIGANAVNDSTHTATLPSGYSWKASSYVAGDDTVFHSTTQFLGKGEKAADSDLLDGQDGSYYAIKDDVRIATTTENNERINADILIGEATAYTQSVVNQVTLGTHTPSYFDVSLTSRPACTLLWDLKATSVTTINTANVYELVAGTSSLRVDSWFNKYGEAGVKYAYDTTHKFFVSVTACIQTNSATATDATLRIYHNGNPTDYMRNNYLGVQDKNASFPVSCILSLAKDDFVELYLTTNDGDDLLVCTMELNLFPID